VINQFVINELRDASVAKQRAIYKKDMFYNSTFYRKKLNHVC